MNKTMKTLIIIGAIVLLIIISISPYNKLVGLEEQVNSAWSQVENVYQRRLDLIPNLVNTVKGEANFEKNTLTEVINARAKATQVTIDPTNMTEQNLQQFQQAQGQVSSALSRLLVSVEQYPQLRANDGFRNLQSQLEGSENRIATERRRFNEVAQLYNTKLRKFPTVLFAKLFGFKNRPYFQADTEAQKAPKVEF
ncbi:MAG TPA: LemA family protein [Bacteroidales bacterium]|nr:LemA family protein [Bacteroidales bacterium]